MDPVVNDALLKPAVGSARSARRRASLRRKLYLVHSWAGFQLTILTFVVVATGTLAVIGDEIDWVLKPQQRIAEPLHGAPAWDAMLTSAVARRPESRPRAISLGETRHAAALVLVTKPDGRPLRLFADPARGAILGEGHWLSAQRVLRDLHRYLYLMTAGIGLPVVTLAALVLATQIATGLVVIKKWAKAMVTVRPRKGLRVLVGDLHRASAMWTLWFTVLIVVTSLWYFAEWGMLRIGGYNPEAPRARVAVAESYQPRSSLPPSVYVAAAKDALPELKPRQILFPTGNTGAVTVMGRSTDVLVRDRASRVFLDPADASVLHVQRPGDLTPLQYVTEIADPLHFGDVGGLWTKWLWFACGLVLTLLTASGTWLTWRRTRQGFGAWHLASTGVLALSAVAGYFYLGHFLTGA